jgi:hypothetical protein
MAATVKDATSLNLRFGTLTHSSVVMQSLDETRAVTTAEASDEDGDIVGLAFYAGQKQEINGSYLVKGSTDIGTLAASLTISGLPAVSPTGTVYLTEVATQWSNTGFKTGSFKAIAIAGVTG